MPLQSVHAADIGRLINPMQCRGQIDGVIAMGFGWALYEKMVFDANGAMVNPARRDYRIPAFADVPRGEIYFADTYDKVGPLGAKAQGECAINCVAPAIANAVADATGVRFPNLPLTPDRIFNASPDRTTCGSAWNRRWFFGLDPVHLVTKIGYRFVNYASGTVVRAQGTVLGQRMPRRKGEIFRKLDPARSTDVLFRNPDDRHPLERRERFVPQNERILYRHLRRIRLQLDAEFVIHIFARKLLHHRFA